MQITKNGIETAAGPNEWFTGAAVRFLASQREQRPLRAGRTNRVAHAPERANDLRHGWHWPRPAAATAP